MAENRRSTGFYLNKHQYTFVRNFLSPDAAPAQLLVAPIGSGRTIVSAVVVSEMVRSGARTVLVLAPAAALLDQFRMVLTDHVKEIPVVIVNPRAVRELQDLEGQQPHFRNCVALTSLSHVIDVALMDAVLSVEWDLIVIDGVDTLSPASKRAHFVRELIRKHAGKRYLAISTLDRGALSRRIGTQKTLADFEVTRWTLKDFAIDPLEKKTAIGVVDYTRTPLEIDFIHKYLGLSKWLESGKLQDTIRRRVVASSLYAAEASLRRLRNRLVHGDLDLILEQRDTGKELVSDEELIDDLDPTEIDKHLEGARRGILLSELTAALDAVDRIETDSKYDALATLLGDKFREGLNVLVFTSYRTTVSFLYNSLKPVSSHVNQLHSGLPSEEVAAIWGRVKKSGGILIAPSHALIGSSYSPDILIFYDVPDNQVLATQMLGRAFMSVNAALSPAQVFVLRDKSNAIPTEKRRIEKLWRMLSPISVEGERDV